MGESAVDEIKSRLDIVELVSDYVQLKKAGQNYKGLCPFHPEKTPSFMVSQPKQIFHCFGCGTGGDAFGFVMKHEGLTFQEALELLAKRTGVQLGRSHGRGGQRSVRDAIKAVNREALAFYRSALNNSPRAREYLEKRGISHEVADDFSLGYAPQGWHALTEHLKRKGLKEPAILKAGLSARGQKGSYDIFRERIMFPIFDLHGDVIAFGGRVIGQGEPKYLNSPDTEAFRKRHNLYALSNAKEAIRASGEAVVVEGYLDAIMCHQHGITNAVAPLGTALTEAQVRILKRFARRVVLVFDGDAAGVAAAKRSLRLMLSEGGVDVGVLLLPGGEDPDSALRAEGPQRMRERLAAASSPVDFMLETATAGMQDTINEALGAIAGAKDPIQRGELVRELADRTGRDERDLREKLALLSRGGAAEKARPRTIVYDEEHLLLSASAAAPEKAADILGRLEPREIRNDTIRGLFEKLKRGGSVQEAAETEGERALVSRLMLQPGFDVDDIDRMVDDCVRRIQRRKVEDRIREARTAGDLRLLGQLLSERQKLLQEAR